MPTRDELHKLIDGLPEADLDAVARFIALRQDPVFRALMDAPVDDEPLTAEDIAAIDEAKTKPDVVSWAKYRADRRSA